MIRVLPGCKWGGSVQAFWEVELILSKCLFDPQGTSSTLGGFSSKFSIGGGREAEGMDWEFGISRCKLLYTECITNEDLLYSTGNHIQYPVINHNGKEHEKECIYVYN